MTKTLIALLVLAASTTLAQAAEPSPCKGLEMDKCGGLPMCTWRQATVAGEPSKAGTPYKRSTKAHCRKLRAKKASPAGKQDA
jgi:hypothetical protein